jgi:hypothetical protein
VNRIDSRPACFQRIQRTNLKFSSTFSIDSKAIMKRRLLSRGLRRQSAPNDLRSERGRESECSRVLPLDEINETVRFGLDHGTT